MSKNESFKPFMEQRPASEMYIPTRIRYGIAVHSSGEQCAVIKLFDDAEGSELPPIALTDESLSDVIEQLTIKLSELRMTKQ